MCVCENRGFVKGCFCRELWQYLLILKAVLSLQSISKRQSVASGEVNSFRLKHTKNSSCMQQYERVKW